MHQTQHYMSHSLKYGSQVMLFFRANQCAGSTASQAVKIRAASSSLSSQAHVRNANQTNVPNGQGVTEAVLETFNNTQSESTCPTAPDVCVAFLRATVAGQLLENNVRPCESFVTPKRVSTNPLHCSDACEKTTFLLTKCCDFHPQIKPWPAELGFVL